MLAVGFLVAYVVAVVVTEFLFMSHEKKKRY